MKKEAREGYKITELGEIPNEWSVKKLKDIGYSVIGLTYSPDDLVEKENGILVLRSSNIKNSRISYDDNKYVNKVISEKQIVKKDDILICSRNGSKELIGKCAIIDEEAEGSSFGAFMTVFRSDYNKYLFHVFNSYLFKRQIYNNIGATINQITTDNLNNFKVIIPTNDEQEKISLILSTVDEQIDNTEKLIQKNQELKRGLMQQLLTKGIGHTEFKETELGEIPKEWKVQKFKDISKVSQGLQIAIEERFREFKQGRLPYITIQYINDKSNSDNEYFIENYNENVVCYKSDILMTRTGNTGIVITNEYGVFHNNFFKVDFDRTKLNKDFLVYYLNTPFIQNLIIRYAGTTTIPDLKHNDFYKLPVLVPKIEEQKKIALILSAMDENIAKYKDKKEKLKILKNGLMQKLLSGEIRNLNFGEN
ncbi:restriction endonuclease subunit S [Clostridium perfringens]|uniref:restriction endonuclease subunit S n=1 Tax=Clostridium perfringens TaxID=1502 RepID=UPI0030CBFF05